MTDKEKKAGKADPIRKETDVKGDRPARREKDIVTEASEESFPASDPPSYMAGSAIAGSPPSRKSDDENAARDDTKDRRDKKKAS